MKKNDCYIRRLRISGLFGELNDRVIDFKESSNCIFGANGSGKTTIINLLVAVLNCDAKRISKIRFDSAQIFISKTDQTRASKFISVEKRKNGEVIFSIPDGNEIRLLSESGELIAANQAYIKEYVSQNISMVFLPLSRMNESDIGFSSVRERDIWWHSITRARDIEPDDVDLLLDPIRRMLISLERSFKDLFSKKQRVIQEELEALKGKVMEKFLIDNTLYKSVSSPHSPNRQIKPEDYKTAKQKFDEIGLRISSIRLEEHFSIMAGMQSKLISTRSAYMEAEKAGQDKEKLNELARKFSDAYRSHTSLQPFHIRLMSILSDVERSTEYRMGQLRVFRLFEEILNSFLVNKKFCFNDVGGFSFKCGNSDVKLEELSSGEKHLLALLGRVALSETNGSVFIADEPELSLHLAWQRKLLPSVKKLAPRMQIIVATHAPAIIPTLTNKIDLDEVVHG